MALEGPRLIYARNDDDDAEEVLSAALRLARELEEVLDDAGGPSASSTRIVRAMAASLVDELDAIVRGARKSGLS